MSVPVGIVGDSYLNSHEKTVVLGLTVYSLIKQVVGFLAVFRTRCSTYVGFISEYSCSRIAVTLGTCTRTYDIYPHD